MRFSKQLAIIHALKPSKPSKYYRLENDGSRNDIYGHAEVTLTASGAEITSILSVLESDLGMEWRYAYCDIFPTLKPRGKYTLRIDNQDFYSVCRNGIYEVDRHFA